MLDGIQSVNLVVFIQRLSFFIFRNESVFCEILMVICERYSDVSTELQRQLCEAGLVSYLITLLKLFKNSYTQDKVAKNSKKLFSKKT